MCRAGRVPRGSRRSHDPDRPSRGRDGEPAPRRSERLGEPRVQLPPARRRQAHGHGRSEQRMGESEALSVHLDDARREGLGQPGLVTGADDGLHERHSRIGKRCNGGCDVESLGSERVETHAQQLVERGRDREILAGLERSALGVEGRPRARARRADYPRRLPDLDQHRPRERRVEAVVQELVRRAEAQAADVDCSESALVDRAADPLRNLVADREHGGHTLVAQPRDCIPNRRQRGRVAATGRRRRRGRECVRQRAAAARRGRRRPLNAGRRRARSRRAAMQPRGPLAGSAAVRARRRRPRRRACPSAPGTRTRPRPVWDAKTRPEIRGRLQGRQPRATAPSCRSRPPR